MQFGIFDENDPLKAAVTWGPIGAEAVLAQFYPPHISLFLDNMDVLKARQEALEYADTLVSLGVTTFFARDILAETIKPITLSFDTIYSILIQRAEDIRNKFNTRNHHNYKEVIEKLLRLDAQRYGANKAYSLNWKLSLYPLLPLGNLMYARDQMNILLTKRVRSHMKKDIRKPEIEIYESVYKKIFRNHIDTIVLPENETFEGGDAYIHDRTIYIGVGARTSIGAALHIFKALSLDLQRLGFTFALVEDTEVDKRTLKEQMLYMHLDTFSNPLGSKQIAVCLSEAKKRKVKIIKQLDSVIKIVDTGKTFLDYLFEDGQNIVSIPDSEQQSFGCNFLSINDKLILVPLNTNKKTLEGLRDSGKVVRNVHLNESTKGFGAAHCMTGQIFRQNTSLTRKNG